MRPRTLPTPESIHRTERADRSHVVVAPRRAAPALAWMLLCALSLLPVRAQQFRAAWADVFHSGMGSASEVDTMVNSLATGHYNVVLVQVLAYMDSNGTSSHGALWKSSILPWSTRVTSSFDPLAYLCTQAHAKGIQVHAWLGGSGGGPYRVCTSWPPAGNATLASNPWWFMVPQANSEGNAAVPLDGNYLLDMGSPDAQDYIISIVRELVTKYPIDGINWDDEINGTGYNQGYGFPAYSQATYARSGLARYRINTGYVGTPSATDAAYGNYRRRFKNELMARAQAEIESIKSNPRQPLWHTAAPLAYDPAPGSCDFTATTPYQYYCDWAGMLQHGFLDAAIPQVYRTLSSQATSYYAWCDHSAACWQYNRKVFLGIAGYKNAMADTVTEMAYAYNDGLDGCATYSYGVPYDTSVDSGNWWTYVASHLYTNIATVPTMPWRNPATATEGMMWGRVQDAGTGDYVDDATVMVSGGPTVKTDGNGYYVATLIPASGGGTVHSTTAIKAGSTGQTIANAVVLPGDVVRYDFTLNGAPAVSILPTSISTNVGANISFVLSASGAQPMTYQWRLNGTALPGATATSYTHSSVQAADGGNYTVVASNVVGMATSSPAVLNVVVPRIEQLLSVPNQGLQLQMSGGPGHFAIEATRGFNSWTQLTTLTATGSVFEYLDPDLPPSQRFYRIRGLP